jgi:N-formylglutamate amidohydrolase
MFEDQLPDYANTRSPRVAAGLGTIPRIVANGADIYRKKLAFADALSRLREHYWPGRGNAVAIWLLPLD